MFRLPESKDAKALQFSIRILREMGFSIPLLSDQETGFFHIDEKPDGWKVFQESFPRDPRRKELSDKELADFEYGVSLNLSFEDQNGNVRFELDGGDFAEEDEIFDPEIIFKSRFKLSLRQEQVEDGRNLWVIAFRDYELGQTEKDALAFEIDFALDIPLKEIEEKFVSMVMQCRQAHSGIASQYLTNQAKGNLYCSDDKLPKLHQNILNSTISEGANFEIDIGGEPNSYWNEDCSELLKKIETVFSNSDKKPQKAHPQGTPKLRLV